MSDTPRTNKEAFFPHDSKYRVCDANFARQLEGELAAANDRIMLLEEAGGLALGYAAKGDFESADEVWRKAKEAKL